MFVWGCMCACVHAFVCRPENNLVCLHSGFYHLPYSRKGLLVFSAVYPGQLTNKHLEVLLPLSLFLQWKHWVIDCTLLYLIFKQAWSLPNSSNQYWTSKLVFVYKVLLNLLFADNNLMKPQTPKPYLKTWFFVSTVWKI